ncbi:MAG: hypothetical protein CM1200mP18_23220 [Gammaproteobacteria bacterium]|nr:MAG: hypothetical protein CM1200mP18_23220 [Gammaproteobacteria bacterium]
MEQSLQDQYYPYGTCFGCGPVMVRGCRSNPIRPITVSGHLDASKYDNGFGFVNGGIISTLLDCHSAACIMKETVDVR